MICSHCGIQLNYHEATRCLDAWVAEKIMGWRTHDIAVEVWKDKESVFTIHKNAWMPSTSIAAAWVVVEKIRDLDIDKQYEFVDVLYGVMKNRGLPKGGLMLLLLYVDPLAICRAVLKAVTDD